MIKVFQVISNPYLLTTPFIYALMDSIDKQYDDVKWGWGLDSFWSERIFHFDIILFHWPDYVLKTESGNTFSYNQFSERIHTIHLHGIKIISYCHNLRPHYSDSQDRINCYDLVYSNSDYIVHMGEYSLKILTTKFPHVKQLIINHPIYNNIYGNPPSKTQSLNILGLKDKYKYILCFGSFRDDEERDMIKEIATRLKHRMYRILAPSFIDIKPSKILPLSIKNRFVKFYYQHKYGIFINGKSFNSVSDWLLPYYYGACEFCLINRKKILNSGTVFMALKMGKIVVGPKIGNVEAILEELKNPTFNPENISSIENAIFEAIELNQSTDLSSRNYRYAYTNCLTELVSQKLHELFYSVLIINE